MGGQRIIPKESVVDGKVCSIEGCPNPVQARGWCSKHYRRKWVAGRLGDGPDGRRPEYQGTVCSLDGCNGTDLNGVLGYCNKHYLRWRNHGDPNHVELIIGDDEQRFWSKVDRRGPNECWPWIPTVNDQGYATFHIGSRETGYPHPAHAVAYEFIVGPIPKGLHIDHLCHTNSDCEGGPTCLHRRCVNPAHLEAVPPGVNTLRGNGPTAKNARKTHCLRGHPFDEENTYITPKGYRSCRACARIRAERY